MKSPEQIANQIVNDLVNTYPKESIRFSSRIWLGQQIRSLVEAERKELERMREALKELKKLCRTLDFESAVARTHQVIDKTLSTTQDGRNEEDLTECYCERLHPDYDGRCGVCFKEKPLPQEPSLLERMAEVLEYANEFLSPLLPLIEDLLQDAKRIYYPEKGWPPHIESAMRILDDDSDEKSTVNDIEKLLAEYEAQRGGREGE